MPLSKKRNRDRMKEIRLHKRLLPSQTSRPVQPKLVVRRSYVSLHDTPTFTSYGIEAIDADGNPIWEE